MALPCSPHPLAQFAKSSCPGPSTCPIFSTKWGLAQGSARPTFAFRDRVRDWNFQSLNFETESETQFFQVSVLRPNPRLTFSKSQYWDRVRDWNFISYSFETESESETERTWYDFLIPGCDAKLEFHAFMGPAGQKKHLFNQDNSS